MSAEMEANLIELFLARLAAAGHELAPRADRVPPLALARWHPPIDVSGLPELLEYKGEFGSELVCFLPFIYWLHSVGCMEGRKILTYSGMKPLYYFLAEEQYSEKLNRRQHYQPYDRCEFIPTADEHVALGSPFERYPDYRSVYANSVFRMDRPVLVVHNKYNNEWDHAPTNHIRLETLRTLISVLRHHFFVVYIRSGISPKASGFSEDLNVPVDFDDRAVLSEFSDVLLFDDLAYRFDGGSHYNFLKCLLYANAYHYITAQGGNSFLCAMYSGSSIIVNHREGPETRLAYADGFFRYLSNPCPIALIARNEAELTMGASALTRSTLMGDRVIFDPQDVPKLQSLLPTPSANRFEVAKAQFATLNFVHPAQR